MLRFLALSICFFVILSCSSSLPTHQSNDSLRNEVSDVFSSIRNNKVATKSLKHHGEDIIHYVASYINDDDKRIRLEAVNVLGTVSGEKAMAVLATALSDPSKSVRDQSAFYLYQYMGSHVVDLKTTPIQLEHELKKAYHLNEINAAAILLTAFTQLDIDSFKQNLQPPRQVYLFKEGPNVDITLPITMLLSYRGEHKAREQMHQEVETKDINKLKFMLQAITSIDSSTLLNRLAFNTLSDNRITDVKTAEGTVYQKRIMDIAYEAFVLQLGIQNLFPLKINQQYSRYDILRLQKYIGDHLPLA